MKSCLRPEDFAMLWNPPRMGLKVESGCFTKCPSHECHKCAVFEWLAISVQLIASSID